MMTVVAGLEQRTTNMRQGLSRQRPAQARRRQHADRGRGPAGDGQDVPRGRDRLLAQRRRREGRARARTDDRRRHPPSSTRSGRRLGFGRPTGHRRRRRGPRPRQRPGDQPMAPDRPRQRLVRPGRRGHPDPAGAARTRPWSTAACWCSPMSSRASVQSRSSRPSTLPCSIPALCGPLSNLMEHVLKSPWYVEETQVPGYWIGGKTGTAQVWDAEHKRWFFNIYNFSCVGFIGRQEGHPDLVVAVKIGEAPPQPERAGPVHPARDGSPSSSGAWRPTRSRRRASWRCSTPSIRARRAWPGDRAPGPVSALGATAPTPRRREVPTLAPVTVEGPQPPGSGSRSPETEPPVVHRGGPPAPHRGPAAAHQPPPDSRRRGRFPARRRRPALRRAARGANRRPPVPRRRRRGRRGRARRLAARPGRVLDALGDVTVLAVPDGLVALGALAAGWRSRFDPLVVGRHRQHRQDVDEGGDRGRPRDDVPDPSDRGQPEQRDRAAADAPAPRAATTARPCSRWACTPAARSPSWRGWREPKIGVVTAVHGVHMSRLGSLAAIEQAKGELVEALPSDGVAVLNHDDRRVRRMAERTGGPGPDVWVERRTPMSARMTSPQRASTACASRSASRPPAAAGRSSCRRGSRASASCPSTTRSRAPRWATPRGSSRR